MIADLRHGRCEEVMATIAECSVDAICTDPPFNWSFMGRAFDSIGSPSEYQRWTERWAREALRLLKPGAFVLVCGGDRTYHRQTCGLEDAGFRVRGCITHLHGQGFPKHKWALKPAAEFWALVQKPHTGSAEANVARWGVGGLNVEACRLPTGENRGRTRGTFPHSDDAWGNGRLERTESHPGGRWPTNVILSHIPPDDNGEGGCRPVGVKRVKAITNGPIAQTSIGGNGVYGGGTTRQTHNYADADGLETVEAWECVEGCPVAELDRQSGERGGRGPLSDSIHRARPDRKFFGQADSVDRVTASYRDTGGASRFFFVAKPSPVERSAGLDGRNPHVTVKPISLMRHLLRLVTPAGGTVLDPFMGSGTTGCGCVLEGFDFIGIEDEAEHVETSRRRIAYWTPMQQALPLEMVG